MKITNPSTPQHPESMLLVLPKDAPLAGDIMLHGIPAFPIPTPTAVLDEYQRKLSEGYRFRLTRQGLPPPQQALGQAAPTSLQSQVEAPRNEHCGTARTLHPPQALKVLRTPRAASLGEQLAAMGVLPPSSHASQPPAVPLAQQQPARGGSVQRRPAPEPATAAPVKRARTGAQSVMSAEQSATIALVLLAQQAPSRGEGGS